MHRAAKLHHGRQHAAKIRLVEEHERLGLGVLSLRLNFARLAVPGGSRTLQAARAYILSIQVQGKAEHSTPACVSAPEMQGGRNVMALRFGGGKTGYTAYFQRVPKRPHLPPIKLQLFDVTNRSAAAKRLRSAKAEGGGGGGGGGGTLLQAASSGSLANGEQQTGGDRLVAEGMLVPHLPQSASGEDEEQQGVAAVAAHLQLSRPETADASTTERVKLVLAWGWQPTALAPFGSHFDPVRRYWRTVLSFSSFHCLPWCVVVCSTCTVPCSVGPSVRPSVRSVHWLF
eukprot:SAG22_NODE_1004_length_6078_cov_6.723532_3_plen_286_part_00